MDSCIVWSCQDPRQYQGVVRGLWFCWFHTFVNPYPFDGKLARKLEAL